MKYKSSWLKVLISSQCLQSCLVHVTFIALSADPRGVFLSRYRKFLRMIDQGVTPSATASVVPEPVEGYDRATLLPTCRVAPDRVFLCRRVYESRQRRLLKYSR